MISVAHSSHSFAACALLPSCTSIVGAAWGIIPLSRSQFCRNSNTRWNTTEWHAHNCLELILQQFQVNPSASVCEKYHNTLAKSLYFYKFFIHPDCIIWLLRHKAPDQVGIGVLHMRKIIKNSVGITCYSIHLPGKWTSRTSDVSLSSAVAQDAIAVEKSA